MTFWAKVFTVLILVLSLVFVSIAGILYTRRIDYQETLNRVTDTLQNEAAEYRRAHRQLSQRFERLGEDFSVQRRELAETQAQLRGEENITAQLRAEVDRLERSNTRLEASNTSLQEILQQTQARREQVEDELATRVRELNEKREQLSAARDEIQTLTRSLTETEEERDELAYELRAARERLAAHDQKFAELRRLYYAEERLISILDRVEPVMADIRGRVLSVDEMSNVIINVGKEDGVMKDYLFTVYRDDKYIAQIRIFKLDESGDLAAGRIESLNRQGHEIKQGDHVATRLIP